MSTAYLGERTPEQWAAHKARQHDDRRIQQLLKLTTAKMVEAMTAPLELLAGTTSEPAKRRGRPRRPLVVEDPLLKEEWGRPGSPRNGNTGAESSDDAQGALFQEPRLKVDWLNVTFPFPVLGLVRERIESLMGQGEDRLWGLYSYSRSALWDCGAIMAWTEGRGDAMLSMNGDAVDVLPVEKLFDLMKWLRSAGAKCTRIDLAFDDPMRLAPIEVVERNAREGNIVGFQRVDGSDPVNALSKEKLGESVLFGRRGNKGTGKYLRVYDKFLESGCDPKQDFIRWELELSNVSAQQRADAAFNVLANSKNLVEFVRSIGAMIGGCVDFKARAGYENVMNRAPRLCWWARIIAALHRADYRTL